MKINITLKTGAELIFLSALNYDPKLFFLLCSSPLLFRSIESKSAIIINRLQDTRSEMKPLRESS